MTSSHHNHYIGGNYHPPPGHDAYLQDSRCQTVVIQQGPSPYGTAPGPSVAVLYGRPYTRMKDKGCGALGVCLLVFSFVLFGCGALRLKGAIGGSNFPHQPIGIALIGFGIVTCFGGLFFCIPSFQHEIKKEMKLQQQQQRTGDQPSTGPDQPSSHQPSPPHYQTSHRPSYQQGSAIPLQPFQSNPSCQQGSTIPPQPFQPITPSTDPPPYTWTAPVPYPNVGFTPYADPEMGYKKAKLVP